MDQGILKAIGNTPMVRVDIDRYAIMAKMENMNPFGSMKDRAAYYTINRLLENGQINKNTTMIESSSGNFAIALSGVCAALNMKCICVVDNNLTNTNRKIIENYGSSILQVTIKEKNQSNQEKRIQTVKQYIVSNENTYWTNQYNNKMIQESYVALAEEILSQYPQVEKIYIPVSTCGTIAGISSWIKKQKSDVKIIAVDSYGSQIFGKRVARNRFTGMGSRVIPGNLKNAIIDKIVKVTDYECIINCNFLLKQGIFVGASSGAVIAAIRKTGDCNKHVVAIFPDRGDRYLDNLYNQEWIDNNLHELLVEEQLLETTLQEAPKNYFDNK